jgi:hypothetical protein
LAACRSPRGICDYADIVTVGTATISADRLNIGIIWRSA